MPEAHGDGPAPLAGGARLSRRALIKAAVSAAGGLSIASLLGACTTSSGGPDGASGSPLPLDWSAWWSDQTRVGVLNFANWPYYIDRHKGSRPSLELFTREKGITVNYYRPIRDMPSFYAKVRPLLEAGKDTGYDLMVLTNGPELAELIDRGWLIPLEQSYLRNFERYAGPLVRDPAWDPGNRYSVAWQSGFTGIAYRPEAVEAIGHEPASIEDLWDPRLRGRVGMMADTYELGSVGLLAIGADPPSSSKDEWRRAAARLRRQRETVSPRYYDQGYLDALARGDVWLSMAWSGDIFQINNMGHREIEFVIPEEGALLWTDNMVIPAGAQHPLDASLYMDYVYQPRIAAMIADWVWYISPVPEAKRIVAEEFGDLEVANSPLVFPGPDLAAGSGARDYYVFAEPAEFDEWLRIFQPIVYS